MTDTTFSANTIDAVPPANRIPGAVAPKAVRTNGKLAARLEREAAARRALFAVSLAGFVALFGLIAVAGKPAPDTGVGSSALVSDSASTGRVVAQAPITGLDGGGAQTLVRIVAPEPRARAPHARTRAS